jgi:hypothetical protein
MDWRMDGASFRATFITLLAAATTWAWIITLLPSRICRNVDWCCVDRNRFASSERTSIWPSGTSLAFLRIEGAFLGSEPVFLGIDIASLLATFTTRAWIVTALLAARICRNMDWKFNRNWFAGARDRADSSTVMDW